MPKPDALLLAEKRVLVTGASKGIGRAIALELSRAGAAVIVNYRSSKIAAEHLVGEIQKSGGTAAAIKADIANPHEIPLLLEAATSQFGGLDILVNNAGADILTSDIAQDASPEIRLLRLIEVDLLGTIRCCWAAEPTFTAQRHGVIVNIAWDLALHGMAGRNPQIFAAAKAGIIGFSKSLACSLAPHIRVNVIAPGWIRTAFTKETMHPSYHKARCAEIPMGRFGEPNEVAHTVLFAANATYLTGQIINVNGGLC